MANDKNWRVGLSFRNLRNIREEDLQENEFRVRSESGQMKPDSACNTYPRACVCVCVFPLLVYSGKQRAGIGSREIGTKILFHQVTFRLCRECVTLLSSLYTYTIVSKLVSLLLEDRKSSWNEFRKILSGEWTTRAASPSPEQFLRTLWHRDTL